MRRPVAALAVSALLATAACAPGASLTPSDGSLTLRLGHVNAVDDPWQVTAEEFGAKVEEYTGGSVEVEVYPSSQLGDDRELVEGMQIGSVQLAMVAGVLSSVEPPITLLELPYLFDDADHLRRALDGPGGETLTAGLREEGIVNLTWLDRGPRKLTASRPITAPDELDNAKIRVPEIPASLDGWRAMGANPTPMAFSEVYGALQQGVIDGQENPYAIIASANLAEVQRYLMETDHVFGYVMLALSEASWDRMDEAQRAAVTRAADEVREAHNARVVEEEAEYRARLEQAGLTFVDVDVAAFRAAVQDVHRSYAAQYGEALYDDLVAAR